MGATALPPRMNKVVATRQASLRQLGFGNSALAVGCGQTLGCSSKSRSGDRVDKAVAHVRQVGQNIAISAGREGKHRLLHQCTLAVER